MAGPGGDIPVKGRQALLLHRSSFLPLLPTPGEPITAIFNSVSVDFLRLMPRVVISSLFCNRPVYFANRRCATLQYLFIYISNCISLSLSVCASGCAVAFTFSISFSVLAIFPLASAFDHNKRKCWPRVTRPLLGLLIAHLSGTMITIYMYVYVGHIGHVLGMYVFNMALFYPHSSCMWSMRAKFLCVYLFEQSEYFSADRRKYLCTRSI